MVIGILYRKELEEYDFGQGHPFRGDRYKLFPTFLRKKIPENNNYKFINAEPVSDKDLLLICEKDYIDFTTYYYNQARLGSLTYEMKKMFPIFHSEDNKPRKNSGKIEEAARLIIGQVKTGIDLIQRGENKKIVSIGGGMHHAKSRYGEGFCIYNDVAYAAKYLIKKYGFKRILILDTDAHAGNGTLDYFYSDPKVLFIDLHQDPRTLYPGTGFIDQIGEGEGEGYTINVPMPLYAGFNAYKSVFEKIIFPVTTEFKPQIIIRNGGSDPHFADKLTNLSLTTKGFRMMGEKVRKLSEICYGKVIDLIASGYNKEVLPSSWLALISGLANFQNSIEESVTIPMNLKKDLPLKKTENVINEINKNLKDYWLCFR